MQKIKYLLLCVTKNKLISLIGMYIDTRDLCSGTWAAFIFAFAYVRIHPSIHIGSRIHFIIYIYNIPFNIAYLSAESAYRVLFNGKKVSTLLIFNVPYTIVMFMLSAHSNSTSIVAQWDVTDADVAATIRHSSFAICRLDLRHADSKCAYRTLRVLFESRGVSEGIWGFANGWLNKTAYKSIEQQKGVRYGAQQRQHTAQQQRREELTKQCAREWEAKQKEFFI